ncbi:Uncharacterised protein [Afipia felis]|uniref:Uncharacterized protein n=2 Tax=Afipia felis TaxID=1035 RepID=A0A380WAK9_AFIFE|nr:hypothetical protein HMPREF9697_01785 [Afipia felis ATCC 53690]SUU77965.1 Uncharacterised protein [Afipia felis]SUU86030.1 Uncharacterised protein [Afipia felis]
MLSVIAFWIYVVGIPISFGVLVKMADDAGAAMGCFIWPLVALGYLGYRLAP